MASFGNTFSNGDLGGRLFNWNASTNQVTIDGAPLGGLESGKAKEMGATYLVAVAGTTNLDGISAWAVGDKAVFNYSLSVWQKQANSAPADVDWGDIGGTLANQTDLKSALDAKQSLVATPTTGDILTTDRGGQAQDSGKSISTDGTLAYNSDAKVPTEKAVKTYADTKQATAQKDASGGYVGLTALKINFKNALNTATSFLTNSNTAARTYTFQDRDGTIADATDLAGKIDKPATATLNNVAIFDASRNVVDSGVNKSALGIIDGEVNTYADLPSANSHNGEIWLVKTTT